MRNLLLFLLLLGHSASQSLLAAAATDVGRPLDLEQDRVYEHIVKPILASKCYSCHSEEKSKGKLALHTPEAILEGGSEGDTLVPGDTEASNLTYRISLPSDDEEAMPPENKPQLTEEEIKLLYWWVEKDGSFDKLVSQVEANEEIAGILKSWKVVAVQAPSKASLGPKLPQAPPAADSSVVQSLADSGILILPLAQGSTFLEANVLNVASSFGDSELQTLKTVAPQLIWLNLARSQVTDDGLAAVNEMSNLTRLHLENTDLTDNAMIHLANLENLEYLNLYGTKVTDAGISKLAGLKNLKTLYLWQTEVTEKGAAKLKNAIPTLNINLGWKGPAKAQDGGDKKKDAPNEPVPDEEAAANVPVAKEGREDPDAS